MDTWLLFLTTVVHGEKAKGTRSSYDQKPFIFKSSLWVSVVTCFIPVRKNVVCYLFLTTGYGVKYVSRAGEGSIYNQAASCYINEKMADAIRYGNWLIPLRTTGYSLSTEKLLGPLDIDALFCEVECVDFL